MPPALRQARRCSPTAGPPPREGRRETVGFGWCSRRCGCRCAADIKHAEWEAKKGTKGVRLKSGGYERSRSRAHDVEYFRIPVVKRALRNTLFCAYIALFSLVVFSRGEHATLADAFADARHYQIETLFALWTIALVVDELHQFHSMEHYFNSVWNQLDLCAYSPSSPLSPRGGSPPAPTFPRRRAAASTRARPAAAASAVAVTAAATTTTATTCSRASTLLFGAAAILFLGCCSNFKHTSSWVLLVIIGEMMNDVASFMAIFVVFLLGILHHSRR